MPATERKRASSWSLTPETDAPCAAAGSSPVLQIAVTLLPAVFWSIIRLGSLSCKPFILALACFLTGAGPLSSCPRFRTHFLPL
eukprot:2113776-Pyramimonas_sp.AAC.1